MSVKVEAISGPDNAAFVYLKGTHEADAQFVHVRTVARSAIAAGHVTVAGEKAALIADVEQAYSDYVASQQALADL